MKLKLKEAPVEDKTLMFNEPEDTGLEEQAPLELDVNDTPENNEVEQPSVFIDETDPNLIKFLCSDELNELRDLFVEFEEDKMPMLLLLDNKVIVIGKEGNKDPEDDNTTFLYCLGDEDEEFTLIKLPNDLDDILANNSIIQYTPSNISDVHNKVVDLFMKELGIGVEEEPEIDTENEPSETIEDIQAVPTEEDDTDEQD